MDFSAKHECWDAIVVGAGPAGGVLALLLSERGWRVLLVEKSSWPREKACGGCLNAGAVRMLREIGAGEVLEGGARITNMRLDLGKRTMGIALPSGVAVERCDLDARLVGAAARRGCAFMANSTARLMAVEDDVSLRTVRLQSEGVSMDMKARVVLACDGLRGALLAAEPWAGWWTAARSRLGFSATLHGPMDIPSDGIAMCVGEEGYVGLVGLKDGRVHVGASLDPRACNAARGPQSVIQNILNACGHDTPGAVSESAFIGTGPLTCRRTGVAGHRVLVVGDACGYVEPFTGEGIAWAIRGAIEAARLLPQSVETWPAWLSAAWQARYEAEIGRRQTWCRGLRGVIGRPLLAAACMRVAQRMPSLPARMARHIGAGV